MSLAGVAGVIVMQHFGIAPGIVVMLATGIVTGLVSGFIIAYFRTTPLVVTLGSANQDDLRMNIIGRLKPGVSIREAQAQLDTIVARIPHSLSNSNRTWSVSVEPLRGALLSNDRKLANWLFLGGVACFLLLESVSVVNLFQLCSDARYQPHR